MWLLISVILVFVMQAGFLCLESGSTRTKNSINVAAKNVVDFVLSSTIFWTVGFGLMFGTSIAGWVGSDLFVFGENQTFDSISFFLFQMMFCGTAATLVSGAVAERLKFWGYIYITVVLSLFVYPIAGHWVWGGLLLESNEGWLAQKGFVDFAGSTVVHSVGGWFALAAILVIGARTGRFSQEHSFPTGSNLPLSALGVFLIWLGWFGFNGGSVLEYNDQVPLILLNTCLSALWSCLTVSAIQYIHTRYVNVSYSLNGIIAGLVGITASCNVVSPKDAALIGIVSGVLLYVGTLWLYKLKIDDAIGVIPAHLFTGIWGTLAVSLFGDTQLLNTGLSALEQFQVQVFGVVMIGAFSFTFSYAAIYCVNRFIPLRVSIEDERIGLNITEHRARTDLIDLLSEMELQQRNGQFTTPVKEEPFTEIGQIASKYNQVISRVSNEMAQRDEALEIEITEHLLIQDIMQCIEVLTKVKELGIKVYIDDFGTGYSSLNYLRKIPFEILKSQIKN